MSEATLYDRLGRWIDELARKWERFLSNDPKVQVPPEPERLALERRLNELGRAEARTAVDRFRLEQLQHRFSVYNQLWQRQLRERELGLAHVPPGAQAGNARPSVSVPAGDVDEIERLHGQFVAELARSGRDRVVGLDRFREALEAQRRELEGRGATVDGFDVVSEDGNVRVRARVRRRRTE